jgi:hypothetical protein
MSMVLIGYASELSNGMFPDALMRPAASQCLWIEILVLCKTHVCQVHT